MCFCLSLLNALFLTVLIVEWYQYSNSKAAYQWILNELKEENANLDLRLKNAQRIALQKSGANSSALSNSVNEILVYEEKYKDLSRELFLRDSTKLLIDYFTSSCTGLDHRRFVQDFMSKQVFFGTDDDIPSYSQMYNIYINHQPVNYIMGNQYKVAKTNPIIIELYRMKLSKNEPDIDTLRFKRIIHLDRT